MSESEIAILAAVVGGVIGGFFGILGVWLGNFLTRKTTIQLSDRQEFRQACSDFRKAFIPEIEHIERVTKKNLAEEIVKGIIAKSRIKHREGAVEFRRILSVFDKTQINAFDSAWINFSCEDYDKRGLPEHYGYCLTTPDNPQPTLEEIKSNALGRIDALLKFAE